MQLSAFNLYVDEFPEAGQVLVYNTFSGGSAVLDAGWLDPVRAAGGRVDGPLPDEALCDGDLGVVVASRASEEAEFLGWLKARKEDTRTPSALVSTSYACNLACTYCFQEAVMSGKTMSLETADATARFFIEQVTRLGSESFEVCFIGGEPLLHPHLIERISRTVRDALLPLGIRYAFQVITNGTLMTPAVIRRLVDLGLDHVQVTIDGDECSHGLTRVDKRGRNTFHETWQNVLACMDLVHISLQGNYTEENLHGFVPLLARMQRDGVRPDRIPRVKFKPALASLGTPADAGVDSCTWSNARPEVQLALGDAVRAFGYTPHDQLDLGPCAIHMANHWSVGPEGLVWKCPGFVGKPEWATGHVETGLTPKHKRLTALANTRECGGCSYRPACAGACIAVPWVATGQPEGVNCERSYFDAVGAEVVKRNYWLDTLPPDEAKAELARQARYVLPTAPPAPAPLAASNSSSLPLVKLRLPVRAPAQEIHP